LIKISKPAEPPDILSTRGLAARQTHCDEYDRALSENDSDGPTFSFDDGIYCHEDVKQALITAQHGKCAFCERMIHDDGDVEHFRPKAACCQGPRAKMLRPGYYWLAYDWDNLLLSCSACNQRAKRNQFPLVEPARRARSHHDDIGIEEPYFIHPVHADPARYISFKEEQPFAIDDNPSGTVSIRALRLDRKPLNIARRRYLDHLTHLRKILQLEAELAHDSEGRRILADTRVFLSRCQEDAYEFAAMARAAAKADFYVSSP
jgi:uncharacterized protein (TIGR02646 family)